MTADELLEQINNDLYHMRWVWSTFLRLFASDKGTIDILNATAPGFFGMTQPMMYDDVVLRINRLTDRAKVAGKDTASLEQLVTLTGWEQAAPVKWSKFSDKLKAVNAACKGCRAHRNRRLSHRELKVKPLPAATRKMVETAIEAIEDFANQFNQELHQKDIETHFVPINAMDNAERLLRNLKNRRSQKAAVPPTRILYIKGSRLSSLECGFCGETAPVGYYPDEPKSQLAHLRLHFAKCIGLIGCEIVTIEAVERNGAERPRTFTVDLTKA